MAVRFPLPAEHRYGRARGAPMVHTGLEDLQESMWLRLWQARMRYRYRDANLQPTGLMDGPTLRVALALQSEAGIPETGMIDEETWNLAWQ